MQQLELFPEDDMVRFAESLTFEELQSIKQRSHSDYYRVKAIRMTMNRYNSRLKYLNKTLCIELRNVMEGRYV